VDRWRVDAAFRDRTLSVVVIVIVLLPLVVSAFALLGGAGSQYRPSADNALIEMNVRGVFSRPPLLGPYSRFGWSQPGPALYYALALPYWLTGGSSASLAFAALFLNALAVVGIMLVARRRGGLAVLVVTALVVEILVLRLGAQFTRDVWNPYVTVLPFLLLVLLAWTMSCGDRWALPVSAFVASFVVQTHVGYALPAAALLAFGIGGLAWLARRRRHAHDGAPATDAPAESPWWRGWIRTVAITAVVVIVMWLPPLIQQLTTEPGNLTKMLGFFGQHGQERSALQAWHVLSAQFGVWPDWLSGHTSSGLLGAFGVTQAAPFPVVLLLLGVTTVLAWRFRRGSLGSGSRAPGDRTAAAIRLHLLVGVLVAASFVAVTRIVGDVWDYLVKWLWALGALAWIAILISIVEIVRSRTRPRLEERQRVVGRVALGLGVASLLVLGVVGASVAATAGTPDAALSRRIATLTDAVERVLVRAPPHGVVEIRKFGASGLFGGAGEISVWNGAGIADSLEQRGTDVRVAPDLGFAYGDDRVTDKHERVRLVVLPVAAPDVDKIRAAGTWRQITRDGSVHLFVQPG
jgi:hypothetical protein